MVVVANGSGVVVVVDDGGADADGRTRHGRPESMECKSSKSRAEMNFMLELWVLSTLVLLWILSTLVL